MQARSPALLSLILPPLAFYPGLLVCTAEYPPGGQCPQDSATWSSGPGPVFSPLPPRPTCNTEGLGERRAAMHSFSTPRPRSWSWGCVPASPPPPGRWTRVLGAGWAHEDGAQDGFRLGGWWVGFSGFWFCCPSAVVRVKRNSPACTAKCCVCLSGSARGCAGTLSFLCVSWQKMSPEQLLCLYYLTFFFLMLYAHPFYRTARIPQASELKKASNYEVLWCVVVKWWLTNICCDCIGVVSVHIFISWFLSLPW